ncbi:hypothetical protein C1645_822835 [Glomus cerebriforme]|uniref:Protein kinase domain-containing protein n=1 Tax=Glomus cerebriforme TaxID=658196 RepID=A0A397T3J4_9GLOM|nr:hypothetical protein C1645_822835 [Glomus cerebriforme]
MRLYQFHHSQDDLKQKEFVVLLKIGNSEYLTNPGTENTIALPENMIIPKGNLTDLIDFVYPNLVENSGNIDYMVSRAILTPKNTVSRIISYLCIKILILHNNHKGNCQNIVYNKNFQVILNISKHESEFSFLYTLVYPGAKQQATAIHKDFHSGNILINQNPFISDLGMCQPANNEQSVKKEGAYGVLPYMAPEVLRSTF